jgi:hypothetical protein
LRIGEPLGELVGPGRIQEVAGEGALLDAVVVAAIERVAVARVRLYDSRQISTKIREEKGS